MGISFLDPKNKILMKLMESFYPDVWELFAVSGGLACALHCGEYRSVEGLSFACPDTSSLLAVATMLEYDEVCSLAKTRPMTLSRFKTGMFLRDEQFGTIKVLWFHEGSLKRYFGPAVFDGESGGFRVLTLEGALFQRLKVFMGRDFTDPLSNIIVDLLALYDVVGYEKFARLCKSYADTTVDEAWYIPKIDLRTLAERSLEHYCLPARHDVLRAGIDAVAEVMEMFMERTDEKWLRFDTRTSQRV